MTMLGPYSQRSRQPAALQRIFSIPNWRAFSRMYPRNFSTPPASAARALQLPRGWPSARVLVQMKIWRLLNKRREGGGDCVTGFLFGGGGGVGGRARGARGRR